MGRHVLPGMTLVAVLVAGCAVGPDFSRPAVPEPEAWRQAAAAGDALANLPWWQVFDDPILQALIRTALAGNQDVGIATARVEEAAAVLGFTRADLFPSLRYSAAAARAETSDRVEGIPGGLGNDFQAGVGLTWEIDLWGRIRRATESARADLLAEEANRRAVTLAVVSAVAELYFALRDLDARLAISRRTLQSRQESTSLIRTRFEGGVVSELDLRQAEVEEATAAAVVPALEGEIAAVENALAVLLGRPPGDVPRGRELRPDSLPETIPAGLPAELLDRRPDVLAAEQRAHAQLARVGVAEALRLPTLSLTGAAGLQSSDLDDFAESNANFWSIGGSLTGPLFEFGKNQRRVEIERARTEQAVLAYERTVLVAFQEVEDALAAYRSTAAQYTARRGQVESARAAAFLSRARYDGGVTSFLEVLDIERSLFAAELAASQALQGRYQALVRLYKALGGGWQEAPEQQQGQQ